MDATSRLGSESHTERPLVTFFLFSYNQEEYIEDACKAALAQTYSPLEIIFSDDFSSDRTFELMKRVVSGYDGPHRVVLNRNERNLGLIGHVNKSFEISSGDLIVAAAGDDVSLPGRVSIIVDVYEKHKGKPVVIHSSALKISQSNQLGGLYLPPVVEQGMDILGVAESRGLYIGATAAWSRSVYKEFGPIAYENAYEDLVLGFRAALKDSLIYIDEPLVMYRFGVGISSRRRYSLFDLKNKVRSRLRLLKTNEAVYRQRMADVACIDGRNDVSSIKGIISRNMFLEARRIDFYERPMSIIRWIFSADFFLTARAVLGECKFLLKK